ncbi:MAG TPA: L,D-transpeptidase [Nocardioidaceae bacterium]|nr:L,D-transpeptidase [Nocardioidaceae bacterium]
MARQHRGPTARPHYPRITAAGSAVLITMVAVFGALGVLPTGSPARAEAGQLVLSGSVTASLPRQPDQRRSSAVPDAEDPKSVEDPEDIALPEDSGEGRRVVFDMSDQRVWLVTGQDEVRRTYLVSGSLTDNLDAGGYEVYSKSLDAIGVDDSGTMKYMVRFAHGAHAAIGFHDIPVQDGRKVQTAAQLGTPQSHGCIRQLRRDAKVLWRFAPIGTTVVVLA